MKKISLLLYVSMWFSVMCYSQAANSDTTSKKVAPPKDRNMFGLHIPRGLKVNSEGLADGYILYAVPNSALIYLVNRKGEVVHEWKGKYHVLNAYLQDDGSVIESSEDPDFAVFAGGGQSGRIQKISWDGKMPWDFEYATDEYLHHHDFTVMPNGHILAIAWEAKTADEALAAGRKPELTPKAGVWPDKIVEIEPQGTRGGRIVWEWHSFDHLIQDYDPKKKNYGNVADHPELINFNAGEDSLPHAMSADSMEILKKQGRMWKNQTPENLGSDIHHLNAVKYNADLDQIVFSCPELSEIFIIDHSTTTEEAAGHKGGRWGKGGDILYRWGNPKNYHRGDSTDQKLGYQHDVQWIEKGKPGEGHLLLFDNNSSHVDSINHSAIYELVTPTDNKGNYILEKGKAYGPDIPLWVYKAPDSLSFWSSFVSGAQRMYNGNTFICEGAKGRFFEVTKDGKKVWEYLNPYRGEIRQPNGDPNPTMPLTYFVFRATFIPADHPGLMNRKLDPIVPQPFPFILPPPPAASDKK